MFSKIPQIKIEYIGDSFASEARDVTPSVSKTDKKTYILATAIIISVIAILAGILATAGINPLALMGDTASKSLIFGGIGLLAVSLISFVICSTLKDEPKTKRSSNVRASTTKVAQPNKNSKAPPDTSSVNPEFPPQRIKKSGDWETANIVAPPRKKKHKVEEEDEDYGKPLTANGNDGVTTSNGVQKTTSSKVSLPNPPKGVNLENFITAKNENLIMVTKPTTLIIRDWTPIGVYLAFEAFKKGARVGVFINASEAKHDADQGNPLDVQWFRDYIINEFGGKNPALWNKYTRAILDWLSEYEEDFEYIDDYESTFKDGIEQSDQPEKILWYDCRYSAKKLKTLEGEEFNQLSKSNLLNKLELMLRPPVPQSADNNSNLAGKTAPTSESASKADPKSNPKTASQPETDSALQAPPKRRKPRPSGKASGTDAPAPKNESSSTHSASVVIPKQLPNGSSGMGLAGGSPEKE